MDWNPAELERLDHQAEADRDRDYIHHSLLRFGFEESRCDSSLDSHLPVIARLCERLAGEATSSRIDLTSRPEPRRTMWAVLDESGRGLLIHHETAVQSLPKGEGQFIDIFWSTVGLPQAFAACYEFGHYIFGRGYDLYLNPTVEVNSNLPEAEHADALREFEASMLALGFPRIA